MAALYIFSLGFYKHLGSGPMWFALNNDACLKYAAPLFLYIQNYYNYDDMVQFNSNIKNSLPIFYYVSVSSSYLVFVGRHANVFDISIIAHSNCLLFKQDWKNEKGFVGFSCFLSFYRNIAINSQVFLQGLPKVSKYLQFILRLKTENLYFDNMEL